MIMMLPSRHSISLDSVIEYKTREGFCSIQGLLESCTMTLIVSCFVFCLRQASCVPLRHLRQVPDRLPRPTLPPSAPNNPWNTVTRHLQVQVQVQVFFIESRIAGVASMSNSIDVSVLGWRLDVART